jgi:hypothetical protein
LIIVYGLLLYLWSVPRFAGIEIVASYPMAMGLLPIVCIVGGRYWPYIYPLALVTLPIAGITLKITDGVHYLTDAFLLMILPMGVMTLAALWFQQRGRDGQSGRTFARYGLILSAVTYFSLNFVFFGYPWATMPAGARHTNCWIFLRSMELLIFGALLLHRREPQNMPVAVQGKQPARN